MDLQNKKILKKNKKEARQNDKTQNGLKPFCRTSEDSMSNIASRQTLVI